MVTPCSLEGLHAIVPGPARPTYLYSRPLVTPAQGRRRGRRGIVYVDGRSKEGRLLRHIRKGILEHLTANGAEPTLVQYSLAERAAWIELKLALLDEKQIAGTFSEFDSKNYYAAVGALRRLYREIGITKPAPGFAALMKRPSGRPRKETAADAA